MFYKKTILCLSLLFVFLRAEGQLFINELMSNNQNTIQDSDGDYSDWLELYNAGASAVNLQGYALSDNPDSLMKYVFPSKTIAAGGFLRVWCSGKNIAVTGSAAHTNFSLSSQGETVFLSNPSGTVLDNVPAVYLPADKSYGRFPNGSANLAYLSVPTPNASNNTVTTLQGVITQKPGFSQPGGLYADSLYLSLSTPNPNLEIRYTLDGSDPSETSPLFSSPLLIKSRDADTNVYSMIRTCYKVHFWLPDWNPPIGNVFKATVVRARLFQNGYFPGPVQTYTYFVDDSIFGRYGNLPIVSVVSDPRNLFNDTTGIYVPGITYQPNTFNANYYLAWDRPANIEMYLPDGTAAFNSNFRINVNGQSSPSSPQKGLNVNASSDYGDSKINYPLFQNTAGPARLLDKFDKIKLRAWGSDRDKALFRDAYSTQFMTRTNLDYEAYRPVVVFIDGEYWGLQELRERDRDHTYYESHYLIDSKNPGFDILEGAGANVLEGDSVNWTTLMNFINANPLSDSANYAHVKTQVDVQSFMLHYMFSIYMSRSDWPDQNEAKWRSRAPDGKWKWIMWDMDATVAYYLNPWYDMFNQAIVGSRGYGPSDLLNSFLTNTEFRNDWVNLFADFMNTEFLSAHMQSKVNEMRSELQPYLTEYQNRWQANYNFQAQTDSMKWWVSLRSQFCKSQILTTFGLPGYHLLHLNVSDTLKGKIRVNTIRLDENTVRSSLHTYPWTGVYFQDVPVPLTAIAEPGYKFIKWLETNDTNAAIRVSLSGDTSFTALFDVDTSYVPRLLPVINEVMASNLSVVSDNYGEFDDWLEIYNPNPDTLDLGDYYLSDNLILPTRFKILAGTDTTKIPPYGFLLVWADDDTEQGLLHTNFKFNSTGDHVYLYAPDGETLLDSISFGAQGVDVSYGRSYDASPAWINFPVPTPHATNVTSPAQQVMINELMPLNVAVVADNYLQFDPWIEIYNPNPDTVDLAGWFITNDVGIPQKFRFAFHNDSTKIAPYGYTLLWADQETEQGILHLNFSLTNTGDCVILMKPDNTTFSDSVCITSLAANVSRGRKYDASTTWIDFPVSTPNATNQTSPVESVLINEVQTINVSTQQDNYGEFPSWVELYNPNPDTLNIEGWYVSNDPGDVNYFRFPYDNDSTKISPHGFMLLWGDGQTQQGIRHLNFTLNANGECFILSKPNSAFSDSTCYGLIAADHSYGRISDGNTSWQNFVIPTPDSNNVDLSTGPEQTEEQSGIFMFPNPVKKGTVYLSKNISGTVSDLQGREILILKNANHFEVTSFSEGVYLINTSDRKHLKLVVE